VRRNEHRDEYPGDRPRDDRPPRVDQRRIANRGPGFEPPLHSQQRPQQRNNPARQVDAEDGERLSKRMGELKLASRREADDWIAAGWVRVNGKVAVLGQRVVGDVQIDIDPAARQQQAELVTVLLHKPIGYVSGQAEDGYEPAVVLFQPENRWTDDPSGIKPNAGHHRNLAPAGRLDIDSTGLLVLTQDGRIARVLIGEDSDVEKEYLVRVEFVGLPGGEPVPEGTLPNAALSNNKLALLNHGLELDGEQLKPAKVSWQNEHQLRFVLREGKKRQIRRMCELVGLKVVGLKRVRIGRIPLGHLPVGQWRYLAPWEKF
jgi:23S rRNA pseudouridine2604 synthase